MNDIVSSVMAMPCSCTESSASGGSRRSLPYVVINMAMSADGKVATAGREVTTFGSPHDQRALYALRATADALLCGARTVEETGATLGTGSSEHREARRRAGLAADPVRVVVSGTGTLSSSAEIWRHPGAPLVVLVSEAAQGLDRDRLRALGAEVWVSPGMQVDFTRALRWLADRHGVRRLIAEGGGRVNAALLAEDRVDELRLTWVPRVFGGQASPTLADGPLASCLAEAVRFRLERVESVGDERFLRFVRPELGVTSLPGESTPRPA